jgi:transcriptional regulator of acetoin/glycerol metabolism
MSEKTLQELRRRLGVVAERRAEAERTQVKATEDLKRLIPKAREAGIPMTEIAQLVGMQRESLYQFMDRHGITR